MKKLLKSETFMAEAISLLILLVATFCLFGCFEKVTCFNFFNPLFLNNPANLAYLIVNIINIAAFIAYIVLRILNKTNKKFYTIFLISTIGVTLLLASYMLIFNVVNGIGETKTFTSTLIGMIYFVEVLLLTYRLIIDITKKDKIAE